MFVRFRETDHRLQLSLVRGQRRGGRLRQYYLGSLGSIARPAPSMLDRFVFWRRIERRLEAVPDAVHAHITASIAARIPPPTAREQQAVARTMAMMVLLTKRRREA